MTPSLGRMGFWIGALCAALVAMGIWCAPAYADTRTVTSTLDSGVGSLRQAITDAAAGDTIDFGLSYPATITLTTTQLSVSRAITIAGPGPEFLALSGNNARRVINITSGAVTISGLTIRDGNVGGGGAGIYANSAVTLTRLLLTDNHTTGGGGALWLNSSCVLISSTLQYNSAAYGGGIENYGVGTTLWVINSTLAYNRSTGTSNASDGGGAIDHYRGALRMYNSTVVSNTAEVSSGRDGIWVETPTATAFLVNTVVAFNGTENCERTGTLTDGGHNLENANTCGFQVVNGSLINTDPEIGVFGDWGGDTPTVPLLPDSPAIDAGDDAAALAAPVNGLDQRGMARPQGAHSDIGAYEARPTLSFSKAAFPATVSPGGAVTFTLTVANVSQDMATGVRISDVISSDIAGLSYTASPGLAITPTGGVNYAWALQDLAPGASGLITITGAVRWPLSDRTITNTAHAACILDEESVELASAAAVSVVNPPATPTPTATATPTRTSTPSATPTPSTTPTLPPHVLAVSKTDNQAVFYAGWDLRYVIVITNTTGSTVQGVEATELLPPQIYPVLPLPAHVTDNGDGTLTWAVGTLAAGEVRELDLWVRSYTTSRGTYTNTVTVDCQGCALIETASDVTEFVQAPPLSPTPQPTATRTVTPQPTATATETALPTAIATVPPAPTATLTETAQPSGTPTPTETTLPPPTPSLTMTATPTERASETPTPTLAPTIPAYFYYWPLLWR